MKHHGLVLFMCAGLLLSGAAILGGSSTWSLLRISYYFWLTDLGVDLAGSVTFIAGALLCLPACWLATLVPYHHKSQSLLATLLCVSTAAIMVLSTAMVSASGLTHSLRDTGAINSSMHRAMAMDARDPAIRSAFAAMQCDLRCCGVQAHTDWLRHRRSLPPSCCGRLRTGKHSEPCQVPVEGGGCLRPALIELRNYANALSALASAIIIILSVTVFAASYTLVTSTVDRQKMQPLRVAFLAPPAGSAASFAFQPQPKLSTPLTP